MHLWLPLRTPSRRSRVSDPRLAPCPNFVGARLIIRMQLCRQMLALYARLGDVMPMNSTVSIEQYECTAHTAFCGDHLLHGKFANLNQLHHVQVRVPLCT